MADDSNDSGGPDAPPNHWDQHIDRDAAADEAGEQAAAAAPAGAAPERPPPDSVAGGGTGGECGDGAAPEISIHVACMDGDRLDVSVLQQGFVRDIKRAVGQVRAWRAVSLLSLSFGLILL